jgi:flagellar hook-associated protein 3 FlgL
MRVTQHAIVLTSLQGLNSNLGTVQRLQQQMTSGRSIGRPSDDPTGANTSMITRQGLASLTQQARNISDGQTFLDSTDSALQNILDQVRTVRNLTVQALNDGAMDAQSQQDVATQVTGIRESLLGQANQVAQGRPLFGGATTGSVAYKDDGTGTYAYVGVGNGTDTRTWMTRQVSDVEGIRVDITGPEAFGVPGSGKDLFGVVGNVAHDVGDPTALTRDLSDLDSVINGLNTALADIGTRSARMRTAATNNANQQLTLQTLLSTTEDIDLPKTIMSLQMQQVGYQAALSATAQSLQQTLVGFLK